ncbi:hypothetical protein AAEU29_20480 [Pseudoalteromonas sp. SSM20]|uniref:hypothetical protein n=1 Tax=Pseudoalteromonas sp. SSM20 TaxID=3139394 RepID=UPI003BA8A6BA
MKKLVKYTEVIETNSVVIKRTCELSIEEKAHQKASNTKVSLKLFTIVLLEIIAVAVVYICSDDFGYKNVVELIKTIISTIK